MNIYSEKNIYKILSNRKLDNNFNISVNIVFKIIYSEIIHIKDKIIKEIKNNNTFIIINLIINLIFIFFALNCVDLNYIANSFYSIGTIIYQKIFLQYIVFIIYDILINFFILGIIFILLFIYQDFIKINIRKNMITKINNITLFIIKFLIIINLIKHINSDEIKMKDSKISLKIKRIGKYCILGNLGYKFKGINYLKDVYINEIRQDTREYDYYFNQTDNFVELIWNDNLNSCENMFTDCWGIAEINLSNFDASLVTSMSRMFNGCKSLTSLDFSNLDTSQVTDMKMMFFDCYALSSLDLSHFNTSKVTDMSNMFGDCYKLTLLNLSNFDTSNVKIICDMFTGCHKLISLNISNFNTSNIESFVLMFGDCS